MGGLKLTHLRGKSRRGEKFELQESSEGFILRPRRIDYSKLGTLRDKIPPGTPPFDIWKFRDKGITSKSTEGSKR